MIDVSLNVLREQLLIRPNRQAQSKDDSAYDRRLDEFALRIAHDVESECLHHDVTRIQRTQKNLDAFSAWLARNSVGNAAAFTAVLDCLAEVDSNPVYGGAFSWYRCGLTLVGLHRNDPEGDLCVPWYDWVLDSAPF